MSGYCKDCGNQHCVCDETTQETESPERSSFVVNMRDEFVNTIIEYRLKKNYVVDEAEMAAIVEYIEKLEKEINNLGGLDKN